MFNFNKTGASADTLVGHSIGETEENLALANKYDYLKDYYPIKISDDSND